AAGEDLVAARDVAQRGLALVVGVGPKPAAHAGVLAEVELVDADPELLERAREIHLRIEDADAAGDGGGVGEDVLAGGGDVVAPARTGAAHRDDDRLFLAREVELARDRVRRGDRSAGAVDAHDHGANARILAQLLDLLGEGARAGDAAPEDRDR